MKIIAPNVWPSGTIAREFFPRHQQDGSKKLTHKLSFYYAPMTWLCRYFADAELFGPDYLVFRGDRHLQALYAPVGGGVLCAVRRSLTCSLVEFSESTDL